MPRLSRQLVAVLGAVLLAGGPVPVAAAEAADWRVAWVQPVAGSGLVPGGATAGVLEVTNDRAEDVVATLGVVDVADEENGCLPQERRSPLEDCGASGDLGTGELSGQVLLSIGADGSSLASATLVELAALRSAPLVVPAGGTVVVEVALQLPAASTNETMTDRVGFGLEVRAQGGEGAVLGVQLDAAGDPGGGGAAGGPGKGAAEVWTSVAGALPATGSVVGLGLVGLAAALVLGGAALWRGGRRGRREQTGPPEAQRVRG